MKKDSSQTNEDAQLNPQEIYERKKRLLSL
jgi:hypothetical protein